jgi:hypothetical protein
VRRRTDLPARVSSKPILPAGLPVLQVGILAQRPGKPFFCCPFAYYFT